MKCPYCFKECNRNGGTDIYICDKHDISVGFNWQYRQLQNYKFNIMIDAHNPSTRFSILKDNEYQLFLELAYVHPITPDTFDYWMNKMNMWLVFS